MCKDDRPINNNKDEGDNMMAIKKEEAIQNCVRCAPAKTQDVLKAIMESNNKHQAMMKALAK